MKMYKVEVSNNLNGWYDPLEGVIWGADTSREAAENLYDELKVPRRKSVLIRVTEVEPEERDYVPVANPEFFVFSARAAKLHER